MINSTRMARAGIARGRILTAMTGGLVLIGLAVLSLPGAASAAGGEQGVLRIHGPGTVFAGSGAGVSLVAAPGASVSFPFEVKNTGAGTAQYNVQVVPGSCDPSCADTTTVTAGSLVVTTLSEGPNGYFTAPIDPGKVAAYTLKVTTPTSAPPTAWQEFFVRLYDTAGTYLDQETALAVIKSTTGTRADDEFVNGASQPTVSGGGFGGRFATSPTVAIGGKATFTVKLANDSTAPAPIGWQLSEYSGCSAYFTVVVKAGTTDITALALSGGYQTPVLAPKASKILTVTITNIANALSCTGGATDIWSAVTNSGTEQVLLFVPLTP